MECVVNVLIKVEKIKVYNFENAFSGMRNPLESWSKSDSYYDSRNNLAETFIIGEEDMKLALRLIKAGSEERKFLRQIFVSMDITAPDYWFKEYATYKIGTTENSTSTMHRITSRLLTENDFSWDELPEDIELINIIKKHRQETINYLNKLITIWQKTKDKKLWRVIIDELPDSYNFLATWTGNYENLRNVYHARKNHKQQEFKDFCKDTIENLPYSELIITKESR